MPDATPPAAVAQQLPADRDLAGEMLETSRKFWLVPAKAKPQVAPDCPEAQAQEIVVCAPVKEDGAKYLPGPPLPDSPTTMEEIGQALHVKLGPAEFGSIDRGDGTRALGARIRF